MTPYYFAYEDLREDWSKLVAKGANMPSTPPVEVCDFVEVMCLSKGITSDTVGATSTAVTGTKQSGSAKNDDPTPVETETEAGARAKGMTAAEIKKAVASVGIVPPRREIEMIRKYYRNEAGLKNEYSKAKILKPPRNG